MKSTGTPKINLNTFNRLFFIYALLFLFSCAGNKDNERNVADVSNTDVQADMAYIPAGTFEMGGKSDDAYPDEFPRHLVKISAFFMDKTEVTNAQFKEFVDATGYISVAERDIDWQEIKRQLPPGTPKPADSLLAAGSLVFQSTEGPVDLNNHSLWWKWTLGADWLHPEGPGSSIRDRMNHPVVHVAREDALAYAKWAGKRLPTEAEWEWAAMGGKADSKYPWGNESVEKAFDKANFWQGFFPYQNFEKDGFFGTAPVSSYPPNGYGLYDMAGNVWEWCQDKYHFKSYEAAKAKNVVENPTGPESSFDPVDPYTPKYVIRGGSFLCNDSYCSGYRVSRRMKSSEDSGFNHTGFRCVKDVKAEEANE